MVRLYLKLVNIQDFSEFDTPTWLKSYNGRMGQKLECSHEVCPQWGRRRKWKLNALVHHALAYLNVKELYCCRQVTTCNSARRNKWKNGVNAPIPLQQGLFKDLFTVIPFNGWLSKIPYNKYKFVFVRVY